MKYNQQPTTNIQRPTPKWDLRHLCTSLKNWLLGVGCWTFTRRSLGEGGLIHSFVKNWGMSNFFFLTDTPWGYILSTE